MTDRYGWAVIIAPDAIKGDTGREIVGGAIMDVMCEGVDPKTHPDLICYGVQMERIPRPSEAAIELQKRMAIEDRVYDEVTEARKHR